MIGMNFAIASKTGESARGGLCHPRQHDRPGGPATDPIREGHAAGHGIAQVVETDAGLRIESLTPAGRRRRRAFAVRSASASSGGRAT